MHLSLPLFIYANGKTSVHRIHLLQKYFVGFLNDFRKETKRRVPSFTGDHSVIYRFQLKNSLCQVSLVVNLSFVLTQKRVEAVIGY